MSRNLDHRLEVVAPLDDSAVQGRLSQVFDVLLSDNVSAWDLQSDGTWHRAKPKKDEAARGSQDVLMRKARPRRRRPVPRRRGAVTADRGVTMRGMRVGVVDVGSNTVRLLVADLAANGLTPVRHERVYLALGDEVERLGRLTEARLDDAAKVTRGYARLARELGVETLDVIVTAPGRQAENGPELVGALASASGAPVRVLSPDEEGRLAWEGVVASLSSPPASIAVCDVGGGSTEVVVGTPDGGPAWQRSWDVGAVRLTRRFVREDPPGRKAMAAIREEVAERLAGTAPPLPLAALAAGGTARAVAKLAGARLGEQELAVALRRLAKRPSRELAKRYRIDPARARTLPAGAAILAEIQTRLETPFTVSRAGIREGALLALVAEAAAA